MTITSDEGVLGGEPRIAGTRVSVRHVAARVIGGGRTPAHVADQFELTLSEVYEALSYYYANVDEIREFRRDNERTREELRERALQPKEFAQ